MSESSDTSPRDNGDEESRILDALRNNVDLPSEPPPAARDSPRDDCFAPPEKPIECFCLHCGHIYMSDLLLAIDVDGTTHYACPVKGCTGIGYKFDIFPVNEEDDEDGWVEDDEDEVYNEEDSDFTAGDLLDAPTDPDAEIPFDPPEEWSPDADTEDEFAEEEEPRYFTRDDYEALKATGEYDRRAEEIRAWWRQCEADRRNPSSGFSDDDIPF